MQRRCVPLGLHHGALPFRLPYGVSPLPGRHGASPVPERHGALPLPLSYGASPLPLFYGASPLPKAYGALHLPEAPLKCEAPASASAAVPSLPIGCKERPLNPPFVVSHAAERSGVKPPHHSASPLPGRYSALPLPLSYGASPLPKAYGALHLPEAPLKCEAPAPAAAAPSSSCQSRPTCPVPTRGDGGELAAVFPLPWRERVRVRGAVIAGTAFLTSNSTLPLPTCVLRTAAGRPSPLRCTSLMAPTLFRRWEAEYEC